MYKLKANDGTNNICGKNVKRLREAQGLSQRGFAKELQLAGFDIDYHFVRRVENGERFVTDIELCILANVFGVSFGELLGDFPC